MPQDTKTTSLETFLIAHRNDYEKANQSLWAEQTAIDLALAYQFYALCERLDAKLGRIADALETLAKNNAPASLDLEDACKD